MSLRTANDVAALGRMVARQPDEWPQIVALVRRPEVIERLLATGELQPFLRHCLAPPRTGSTDSTYFTTVALAFEMAEASNQDPLLAEDLGLQALNHPIADPRLTPVRLAVCAHLVTLLEDRLHRTPVADAEGQEIRKRLAFVRLAQGSAYHQSVSADRAENLESALDAYRLGLEACPEEAADLRACLLVSRGASWKARIRGDPRANLRQAIASYKEGLRYRPRERTPLEWAGTVAALGTAYLHRAQLPQGENAAAGEEQAERPAARDLSQGIYWLEEARAVFQSQRSPESQAECLLNLGTGYAVRGRSADLQQAIACFREALTLYESLRQPVRAALVWNNLGAVHGRLTPPDHGEAGRCFRQAAELNARQGVHRETVVAFANLAAVQVDAGDWDAALASFAEAARWSAQEFVASLGEHGRLAWLRRQATVYDGLVAGHTLRAADARHAQQAACWAEQGRARHLADVMAGAERSPRGVQRAEQEEYRKTAHRLRDLDHQLETLAPGASDDCCEDLRTRRRLALEEVRRLRHRFAALDPEWAAGAAPLTAQEIGEVAAQAGAALLTLRPTHWGTAAVVVLPDGQIAATLFESFTEQILRKLLVGSERDGAGGWMTEYQRMRTGATPLASWRGTADMVLGHLGRDLWQPLLAWLAGLYRPANPLDEPRPLAILPGAGLSALPLHAAWWEDTGRRRWACDDYRISYAPSLWVLRRCLERSQRWAVRGAPDLLAVRNPTGDLQLAIREVDWIAPLFPHAASILGQADDAVYPPALRQRLLEELPRHAIALLSTHGTWDPLDPWTRSGLATADAATQPQLRLGDLFGLDLSGLRLAVLSACESALTDFRDVTGEQLGLPSAFLAAGAATVVGSLWLVEDRSTALLVRLFFEELLSREGSRPGVGLALWRAQRRLRELSGEDANALLEDLQAHRAQLRQLIPITFEADPVPVQNGPFAHPYYWAAFGCYGAF